jgi:hypothetical protein
VSELSDLLHSSSSLLTSTSNIRRIKDYRLGNIWKMAVVEGVSHPKMSRFCVLGSVGSQLYFPMATVIGFAIDKAIPDRKSSDV